MPLVPLVVLAFSLVRGGAPWHNRRMKTIHNILLAVITFASACFAFSPTVQGDVCGGGCDSNDNTSYGSLALFNNKTGFGNTAIGFETLYSNTTGNYNTAVGWNALDFNNGFGNTATGFQSLEFNTSGDNNTATGDSALFANFLGNENTAIGSSALFNNFGADDNTAIGASALYNNENGINNTAVGANALYKNKGDNNIALGVSAGYNLHYGSNNIYIGNAGNRPDNNDIRIGTVDTHKHTFIAGISGSTIAGGVGVIIDADGHLGTIVSSARFKQDVKPMDKASEAILALKPLTFRYKKDLDPDGIPQFGLVAEEVEKVDPELVAKDNQGKPYTVRYEAVNAMLLNEFLKEHRKVEEQERTNAEQDKMIAEQQKQIAALAASLKEQAAQIQKVNAQLAAASPSGGGLEMSASALQTIASNH